MTGLITTAMCMQSSGKVIEKKIVTNGEHSVTDEEKAEGVIGYAPVTVAVPEKNILPYTQVTVTDRTTYIPPFGYDGVYAVDIIPKNTTTRKVMDIINGFRILGEFDLGNRYKVQARLGEISPNYCWCDYSTDSDGVYASRKYKAYQLLSVICRNDIPIVGYYESTWLYEYELSYDNVVNEHFSFTREYDIVYNSMKRVSAYYCTYEYKYRDIYLDGTGGVWSSDTAPIRLDHFSYNGSQKFFDMSIDEYFDFAEDFYEKVIKNYNS